MKPTLIIEEDVFKKVMHWVNKSQYEVSGLGTVRVEADGVLRVVSAMLLPQKNGATHTDIEAEEVNKALFELKDQPGHMRWWWHSHVNMAVFWSGTDMDTIKKIGAGGWFAASVFNKKHEIKSAYYGVDGQSTPWGCAPLFLDDLDTRIQIMDDPRIALWDEEYAKNVTNQMVTTYPYEKLDGYKNIPIALSDEFDEDDFIQAAPPAIRPENMSKKRYRGWKKAWEDVQSEIETDDYGFTTEERMFLAQQGWDQRDIDDLLEDFSPTEVLELSNRGVGPQEIAYLMAQKKTAEEILELAHGDIPLHDYKEYTQ